MELDELKYTWNEMNQRVSKNKNPDLKLFDKMNQQKIHRNLYKIILPEILGSIVCLAGIVYVVMYFHRLNTIAFKIAGGLAVILLIILPVFSIMSIRNLLKTGNPNKSYAESLKEFSIQKIQFCKLQKLNSTLSYLLLVVGIILSARIFGRNSVTDSPYFWIVSLSFGYIFLLFFSRMVSRKYSRTIRQAEDLLKEIPG